MRRIISLAALILLAACGQKAELEPLAGHTLPPPPMGAKAQPDTEKLLELDPLAAPPRSVEMIRSDSPNWPAACRGSHSSRHALSAASVESETRIVRSLARFFAPALTSAAPP